MPLDLGIRNARPSQVAAEAEETSTAAAKPPPASTSRSRAPSARLEEAQNASPPCRGGERAAKAWINALSANFAAGLAETKDFQDALIAFFSFRVRVLQAPSISTSPPPRSHE